ncbi:SDR family oxidoreductase [Hydrogenophaga sp.]|uniref:UDP-glucose 4-epimerase family protein n=1 Tax=Hydrogenophaga sp. TaxID=1904254 RepID=UPI002721D0C7|nr:SDR family oxidoreductase [Hydrogenophaga sp.]MDO9135190.1 SDR family oxidoreductase [Hydrogenophaga sp.]
MKVLITGSKGFVGTAVADALARSGQHVVRAVRQATPGAVSVGNIDAFTSWWEALAGCDLVIHLAARVHQMHDDAVDPLTEFRRVNTDGTIRLAEQAQASGVKRFIFLSSVKVNGEESDFAYRHADLPAPKDPYGQSKFEAEQSLRRMSVDTAMDVVVVRPPLVYGPGVKANFASLMRAVQRGIPLPLASVTDNRRSFVALDNLVDLLITCVDHPAAANQTFLVSDGEDLSTADLLHRLGEAMGKPARLFPVPPSILQFGANLLGKGDMAQRLLGNLQVDISHTRNTLNWTPPISVDEGLRRAVAGLTP